MKKFVCKMLMSIAILILLGIGVVISSTGDGYGKFWAELSDSENYGHGPTEEIVPYIKQAETVDQYTKLIIGDSVCHQIFHSFQKVNPTYDVLGSNQAITIVGQEILAEKYLMSHTDATDVYLILTSATGTGFENAGYCYQYFVIPFTQADAMGPVDSKTWDDLIHLYGPICMNRTVIDLVDRSSLNRKIVLNLLRNNSYDNAQLSIHYIKKLIKICDEHRVHLHLLHAPMAESAKVSVVDEKKVMLSLISENDELKGYLMNFYDKVLYYPDEEFEDGIHFGKNYSTTKKLTEVIFEIQNMGELKDFAVK